MNIGGVPGQISISTVSTSSSDTSSPLTATPSSANAPNIRPQQTTSVRIGSTTPSFLIEQLTNGLIPDGINVRPSANITAPSAIPPGSNMMQSLMREAINLMNSSNINDSRLSQPLSDFMRVFGVEDAEDASSASPSTSTLSIFNIFFSSMSLGDMINLARGVNRDQVFERSRIPLRNHMRTFFVNGTEPSEENLNSVVEKLYQEMFVDPNGLAIDFTKFELVDEKVDLVASVKKLVTVYLKSMADLVYDAKYDLPTTTETWSAVMFKKFNELIHRLIALSRECIRNADAQFTQIVTQKLGQALIGSQNFLNSQLFTGIFENFIRSQAQQTLASVTLCRDDVQEFIVYKHEEKKEVKTSIITPSLLVEDEDEDNQSVDSNRFDSASSTLSGNSTMDIEQRFNELKDVDQVKKEEEEKMKQVTVSIDNASSSHNNKSKIESDSNSWKSVIPSEWVAAIENDLESQKIQTSSQVVRSFSDAYCSGMPAKRRKILSSRNDLMSKNLFKKVLDRTLNQIKLKPNVSNEEFVEESVRQSTLIDSFSGDFDDCVTERLRNDPDFSSIIRATPTTGPKVDSDQEQEQRFKSIRKRFNK